MYADEVLPHLHDRSYSSQEQVQRNNDTDPNSVLYAQQASVREVSLFRLTLNPISSHELIKVVEQGILNSRKWIITNHNLHSVYLFHRRQKIVGRQAARQLLENCRSLCAALAQRGGSILAMDTEGDIKNGSLNEVGWAWHRYEPESGQTQTGVKNCREASWMAHLSR